MKEDILKKLEEVLELEDPIKETDVFRDYEDWDSLSYLSVIAMIDEDFGIVIPNSEFKNLQTIKDIVDYIISNKE
jgi:acyl carrier protein